MPNLKALIESYNGPDRTKGRVEVVGRRVSVYNSFAIKDKLKALGFRYDGRGKCWYKLARDNLREVLAELQRVNG